MWDHVAVQVTFSPPSEDGIVCCLCIFNTRQPPSLEPSNHRLHAWKQSVCIRDAHHHLWPMPTTHTDICKRSSSVVAVLASILSSAQEQTSHRVCPGSQTSILGKLTVPPCQLERLPLRALSCPSSGIRGKSTVPWMPSKPVTAHRSSQTVSRPSIRCPLLLISHSLIDGTIYVCPPLITSPEDLA